MIKYAIEYEHLQDDLIKNDKSRHHFNRVKSSANKYKLELNDEEFLAFFKLSKHDEDVEWIMHKMSAHNSSLIDVLISYMSY